ncbi:MULTISPECIES: SDR family NAD(P)-dependent oxidoreductase [Streptococcus]|jgi:NAD(P)-dependent dehydrogenase (short-subunit alcohol dehydrogenase family)|uniref:SDR family NAD(P)-dependent oxidoreductase n=1 Tax=Streptococcus TaxID=1301 RepID=UPI000D03864A|nr:MULTISPECIES: SDR family NAD(P)-dependent oxidoreductase [Streptococcus]MDB8658095.1 SDR family NAD(P)-dependent oxidoreductase [Streptococcus anginosus]MDX5016127.1 SDR family NAD(P)-dependent oxidoreductase [Streptococcus anginosus]MDX5020164.1 SDR family NAD(P)-dependent oxidoreductase [Streptococcus anginosus]PRT74476.1 dehydrogenase [Streptococcus anginosus]VEE13246.1 dehydrogenase [Streptococcus milleri]
MKKCIITGGNSGIGYQAAKQLADKGWQVTIFCRSKERAESACETIISETGNSHVSYLLADLSDLTSTKTAIENYIQTQGALDVLINNAADFDLSIKQPVLTKDGLEKQFATNVVAPFLLSQSFISLLKESESGRILNISSQGLQAYPFIKLNFDNLKGEQSYTPSKTYYQNKLALLMLTLAMRARYKDVTIQAIRVPSVKVDMKRYSHLSSFMKNLYKLKSRFSISPEEMAQTYVALATGNSYNGFLYNEKCQEVKANRSVYDQEAQEKLYRILTQLTTEKTGE